MQWETDISVGSSALAVLSSDRTLHLEDVNFNSTAQDPWWLMDQVVVNETQFQNDIAMDVTGHATDVSRISVFSPFETHHLSDISMSFPLLVLPNTLAALL